MMNGYRICEKCVVQHYENCNTCFGFGVYKGEKIEYYPVSAAEAHGDDEFISEVLKCPECSSTEIGIPETAITIGKDEND